MRHVGLTLTVLGFAACTGAIEGQGTDSDLGTNPANPADPTNPANPANPATPRVMGPIDPGHAPLRRLTRAQIDAVVFRVLGVATRPSSFLPPEDSSDGFTNQAEGQVPSAPLIQGYARAAADLSLELIANLVRRSALVGCVPSGAADAACLTRFVQGFGRRAYRRTLTDEETRDLVSVGGQAAGRSGDFWDGVRTVIECVLQAPSFLYRPETTRANSERPDLLQLDGWSTASRLSFLLWNESPDDSLLDAAERDQLATRGQVEEQARRLLGDPRSKVAMRDLYEHWLLFDQVRGRTKDRVAFPGWSVTLQGSMVTETSRLLEKAMWGGGDFMEIFDASQGFVDAGLAKLYGLPPVTGGFKEVPMPAERRGLVGQAAFLSNISTVTRTSPTLRGHLIRDMFLCLEVPPPPADVSVTAVEPSKTRPATARERFAVHAADPSCAGCHSLMDPIGFGLEKFDGIGALRQTEGGQAIDDKGEVKGVSIPGAFQGAAELASILRRAPETRDCLMKQVLRWSLGRHDEEADAFTLQSMADAFEGNRRRFPALATWLATSDALRFRRKPTL